MWAMAPDMPMCRSTPRCSGLCGRVVGRGCHQDAHLFFFLLWHPLSDVWWLPTNRHRLPTNRHWLHTNAIGYPLAAIVGRIGHSEFFFLSLRHPLVVGGRARD